MIKDYTCAATWVERLEFVAVGMLVLAVALEAMERRPERTAEPAR